MYVHANFQELPFTTRKLRGRRHYFLIPPFMLMNVLFLNFANTCLWETNIILGFTNHSTVYETWPIWCWLNKFQTSFMLMLIKVWFRHVISHLFYESCIVLLSILKYTYEYVNYALCLYFVCLYDIKYMKNVLYK